MSQLLLSDKELAFIERKFGFDGRCPTCLGKGTYKLDEQEHECNCVEQIRLTKVYYRANIDARWHVLDMNDFQSIDRKTIVPFIEDYLAKFESNYRYGRGWNLGGNLASGKTLVLCSTLKSLLKMGYSCYFIQGPELLDITISARYSNEDRRLLDETLRRVQVLGLDELQMPQSEGHKAIIAEALEGVIRHRYNNSKPTLITTNLSDEEQYDYYPRVFSLLSGANEWLRMSEKSDWRAGDTRRRMHDLCLNEEVLPVV